MKNNIFVRVFLFFALFLIVSESTEVSANSIQDIEKQEQQTKAELTSLQENISVTMQEVNEINNLVLQISDEIEEKESIIQQTTEEIIIQEEVVNQRLEQAKSRLQSIQTNEMNQNILFSLLDSESISDLINRMYVLMSLQEAGNEQIKEAEKAFNELTELKDTLASEQDSLKEKNEEAQAKKEELDSKMASIQELIKENEQQMVKLAAEKNTEIQRQKEIAAQKEAAAKKSAKQVVVQKTGVKNSSTSQPKKQSVKTNSSSTQQPSVSENKDEPVKQTASSTSRTLTVSATGYSTKQPGLSTHTAMGIDLRINPMVIAVDPRVIPLGTMVEVPGYGIAIAGDTGGAIKGNKIDIHYTSVQQALNWGRRTITIKILD